MALIKHGESVDGPNHSAEYRAWIGIKERCYNTEGRDYHLWGGRGITMYEGWRNSYPDFLSYVGRKPSPEYSLDRWPDKDGNYEPGNVRWTTQDQQCRNRNGNRKISFNGGPLTVTDVAAQVGMNKCTLRDRLNAGMSVEDATSIAVGKAYSALPGNRNGSSSYKGVSFNKREQKWRAFIRVNQKSVFLGSFREEFDAAQAYNLAAFEHFGDTAFMNVSIAEEPPQ